MREEFVKRVLAKEKSKSALCQEYGISRPTGDKWIKRYLAGESLSDRSRRPFHTPNRIPEWAEHRIVQARKQEPAVGAQKIHRMLQNDGWHDPPSVSTINAVFKRNGLITPQASEKAQHIQRFEMAAPNVMWQADFKGDFCLRDKTRCYPLSLLDDHSRFCLCADAKRNMQFPGVFESFQNVFRTYGLPNRLLCDNGVPWGSNQKEYITAFDVWLMELGILVIHIRPYRSQTQGKVERFNGSYTQERLQSIFLKTWLMPSAHGRNTGSFTMKNVPTMRWDWIHLQSAIRKVPGCIQNESQNGITGGNMRCGK